jgi:hypothetical protein
MVPADARSPVAASSGLALLAPSAGAGDPAFIVPAPLRPPRIEDARRGWPRAPACAGLRRARNGAPLRGCLRSPIRARSGVASMGRSLVTHARAPAAGRSAAPGVSALLGSRCRPRRERSGGPVAQAASTRSNRPAASCRRGSCYVDLLTPRSMRSRRFGWPHGCSVAATAV